MAACDLGQAGPCSGRSAGQQPTSGVVEGASLVPSALARTVKAGAARTALRLAAKVVLGRTAMRDIDIVTDIVKGVGFGFICGRLRVEREK